MEKKKKGIRCSYAVLVIILFATVCILTDYIVIERKTRVNNCTKCGTINNEVISDNIENKDNTDNAQVTEIKTNYDYPIVSSYDKYNMDGVKNGAVIKINGIEKVLDDSAGVRNITVYKGFILFFNVHIGYSDLIIADSNGNFIKKFASDSDVEGRINDYYIKDDMIYLSTSTPGFDVGELCVDYKNNQDRNLKLLYRFKLVDDSQFSDLELIETVRLVDYVNSKESVKEECSKDIYR